AIMFVFCNGKILLFTEINNSKGAVTLFGQPLFYLSDGNYKHPYFQKITFTKYHFVILFVYCGPIIH
ncbi:MAG: hypothetical protein EGQ00_05980, partial [Parabacteroides johnsonii]|nr:hypothetical protein [Parabacteroides johnsonii]MBD9166580.1 hypothetical protein [Parabacteroides johnsonii]